MNFHVFKFSEAENGHYFFFISPFNGDNIDLVSESIEHYISNPVFHKKYLIKIFHKNIS